MGGLIDIEQNKYELVIHDHDHDCDLLVTKVRCNNLPDSDRGDFRCCHQVIYRQVSNIRRTLAGYKIVDHSDEVGASPVGAAPTTSSFST